MKNIKNIMNEVEMGKMVKILSISIAVFLVILALGLKIDNLTVKVSKKDIEIQELKEIHQIKLESAQIPSHVEELSWMAEVNRRMAVEEFEFAQAWIKRGEEMLLKAKCYKEQVNRLMNNKAFSWEYCEVLENLEQYKVKK